MNNKNLLILLISFVFLAPAAAYSVSLGDVLANPKKYDRKDVVINGEVIGEAIKDKDGAWVNVLSDGSSLGVFFSDAKATEDIKHWGSYKETGDQVRISGTFYENCLKHQVSDIHAEKAIIIKNGQPRDLAVKAGKIRASLIFFALFFIAAAVYFIKVRYARKV